MQKTYKIDGRVETVQAIAAEQAASVRSRRRVRFAAAPAPLSLAAPMVLPSPAPGPLIAPATLPTFAPPAIVPTPEPVPPPPAVGDPYHLAKKVIGEVKNFMNAFKLCATKANWGSPAHTCYLDATSGKFALTSPPATSALPAFAAPNASVTPPPLASVEGTGVHPAETELASEMSAIHALAPPATAATSLPANVAAALTLAEKQAPFARAALIPTDAIPSSAQFALDRDGTQLVGLTFETKLSPPDFYTQIGSAGVPAWGSVLTSSAVFHFNANVLGTPVAIATPIATFGASAAVPLDGSSPTIVVQSDVLGVQSQRLVNHSFTGPSLHYAEARSEGSTSDPCASSHSIPIADGLDLSVRISCPVSIGYAFDLDATPAEASTRFAPVVTVGLQVQADASAAGGLLSVGALGSLDVFDAEGRVGGYADLVRDPTFAAAPKSLFVTVRPYSFATIKSGDGSLWLVISALKCTTYLKIYSWRPLYKRDVPDGGALTAYPLVRLQTPPPQT